MAYFDKNGPCFEENTCRTERMYIHQSSHLYLFSKPNLFSSLSLYLLSGKVWQQQQQQQLNSKFKNIVAEVQKIRTRNMKYSSIELWLAYHSAVASCSLIPILPACEILSGSFSQPHHCLATGSSWKSEGCCHGLPGLWLALKNWSWKFIRPTSLKCLMLRNSSKLALWTANWSFQFFT